MFKSFLVLEKKHVIAAALALAVFIALSAFAANLDHTKAASAVLPEEATLVIDAGHGGIDGGAVGADGSRESDINLAIALRLQAVSAFCGQSAVMTRTDDSRGADALSYSEHEELVYRTQVVNATPNAVLLSIHQNSLPASRRSRAARRCSTHRTGKARTSAALCTITLSTVSTRRTGAWRSRTKTGCTFFQMLTARRSLWNAASCPIIQT